MLNGYNKKKIVLMLSESARTNPQILKSINGISKAISVKSAIIFNILMNILPSNEIALEELILLYISIAKIDDSLPFPNVCFEKEEIQIAVRRLERLERPSLPYIKFQLLTRNPNLRNIDRKAKYIFEIGARIKKNSRANIINDFASQYSSWEDRLNKDICEFTKEDFSKMFSGYNLVSFSSEKSMIQRYFEWCNDNAIIADNEVDILKSLCFEDIDVSNIVLTYFYSSFEELLDIINYIHTEYEKRNLKTIYNNVIIPAFCFAWVGFDFCEIASIKIGDIDFENGIIRCSECNKTVTDIEPLVLETLKTNLDYSYEHVIHKWGEHQKCKQEYVRTQISNYNIFGKIEQKTKPLQYKKARDSGVFFRMFLLERELGVLTVENFDEIKKVSHKNLNKNNFSVLSRSYNIWKETILDEKLKSLANSIL